MREIITTERTYIKRLRLINKVIVEYRYSIIVDDTCIGAYGVEAYLLDWGYLKSLDSAVNRFLMLMFQTNDIGV